MSPSHLDNLIDCFIDDHQTQVKVAFKNETVWLLQSQISNLFQRDITVITKHISNIFKEGELSEGRSQGIPKILLAMVKNCSLEPEFDTDENHSYFSIRLPIHTGSEKVTPQVTPQVTTQVSLKV